MTRRYAVAVGLATVLGVAALVAAGVTSSASGKPAADKLTVWLHPEAADGWPQVVSAANAAVRAKHSGADIDVQMLAWGANFHAKFKAALAAGNPPDVIEMGNSETLEYMAAGAFTALSKKVYPNSATWLKGLASRTTQEHEPSSTARTTTRRPGSRERRRRLPPSSQTARS
jgi:N,N'-diacetylchitobiose transport system substrate-binding protein